MTNYIQKTIRVAIYVRVSTKEQAMEGYSIGEQTKRLKKFCEAHDWCIVKIYTDAGHSGANQDRPALQEMIEDIKEGRIDKVLVYKLDRLSRSQKDTLELIEDVFLKNNTDFESMNEKLDTSTAHGRAMVGILAAFAQLEREMITERMSMGIEARVKEGKWRGGRMTPFGYDYDPALEILVPNEYESMIVKNIYDMWCSGVNIYTLSNTLREKGHFLSSRGSVDNRNIKRILQNKTYCGYMRRKDTWLKGLHEPIISEEVFDAAQKRMEEKRQRIEAAGMNHVKPASSNLGGLLFCAHCGARFTKVRSGSAKYGFYYNYVCYSRNKKVKHMIKDPNCRNKLYRVDDLDQIIFDEIRKLAVDPTYIDHIKKDNKKSDEAEQIQAIEHQLTVIDSQLSRFMDLYGLGKYDLKQLDEKMDPLNEQKLKLQKDLNRLKEESSIMTESEVIQVVQNFDEVIEKGTLEERRSILETLINRIEIDNEDITIHWNFV